MPKTAPEVQHHHPPPWPRPAGRPNGVPESPGTLVPDFACATERSDRHALSGKELKKRNDMAQRGGREVGPGSDLIELERGARPQRRRPPEKAKSALWNAPDLRRCACTLAQGEFPADHGRGTHDAFRNACPHDSCNHSGSQPIKAVSCVQDCHPGSRPFIRRGGLMPTPPR